VRGAVFQIDVKVRFSCEQLYRKLNKLVRDLEEWLSEIENPYGHFCLRDSDNDIEDTR